MIDKRLRLGEALPAFLRLPLGRLELARLVREERLHGLLGVARDDVEAGGGRGELALLEGELGLLVLQGLGRVDHRGFRARLRREELRAHVDALLQRRNQPLLVGDGRLEHVALGRLLRFLRPERGDRRRELAEVGGEHALFAGAKLGRDVAGPGDGGRRREVAGAPRRERLAAAHALGLRGGEIGSRLVHVGVRRRGVELDEHVSRPDLAVVDDMNGGDPPGLHRLDHLHPSGRLELALGCGDDVDAPEPGEAERDGDEPANRPQERNPHRGGRRLEDLEDRREKLAVRRRAARSPEKGPRRRGPADRRRAGFGRDDGAGDLLHAAISIGFACRPQR